MKNTQLVLKSTEKSSRVKRVEKNRIYNSDCFEIMKIMPDKFVDMVLTDIPYEKVNKASNGLRVLNKGDANKKTFELKPFLKEILRVTKGSGYIFCGKEQVSSIFGFFNDQGITTRLMIWEKTNPSPMNCGSVWMSGIECFVYFKKRVLCLMHITETAS